MKNNKRTVSKLRHYTIVEMMMVIAVFMIILSMAMAAWLNSGDQAKLKNAARLFANQLRQERSVVVSTRSGGTVNIEKDSKGIAVHGSKYDKVYLPGNIQIATKSGTNKFTVITFTSPKKITFNPNGNCTEGDGDYCIVGELTDSGELKNDSGYYLININKFTGRITTTYHEVE